MILTAFTTRINACVDAIPSLRSGQASASVATFFFSPSRVVLLVVEAVAEFGVDLARFVPMESAEGEAVVELHAAVGEIDRGQ